MVDIPATLCTQPRGHCYSTSVGAHCTPCNVSRNISVVSPCATAGGPVTCSTAATLAAAASSERFWKRPSGGWGSTTNPSQVKQVFTDRPITTFSFSATRVVAAASIALSIRAPSSEILLAPVQTSHNSLAAPSLLPSTGLRLRSASSPIAPSLSVSSERPSLADAPLSSALPSTISVDRMALIDTAIPRRPPSPVVSPRVTPAPATGTSHASVHSRHVIDRKKWNWPPG